MTKKAWTTGEIAKHCGVTLRTVIRWIERGSLKAYKLPGRGNNRVNHSDLVEFLDQHGMPALESPEPVHNKRVLICDDEPAYAQAINRVLQRASYQTEIAFDGFQAGMQLANFKPSLMTLDLNMPNMNGFEVLQYIRSTPEFNQIKIVVISGLPEQELNKAKALGADAVLAKPFSPGKLLELLATLEPPELASA